ncbi:MAG: conjugative transposon protein TraM [Bacteroidota bacterium]
MKVDKQQLAAITGFLILGGLLIYGAFAFFGSEEENLLTANIQLDVPSIQNEKNAYESRLLAFRKEKGDTHMTTALNLDQYFELNDSVEVDPIVEEESSEEVVISSPPSTPIRTSYQKPPKVVKVDAEVEAEDIPTPKRKREKSLLTSSSQNLQAEVSPESVHIPVAVHGNHDILPGEAIKLRILETVELGERKLQAGSILQASSQLQGERLLLHTQHIQTSSGLINLNLQAYDQGLLGMQIANPANAKLLGEVENQTARNLKVNVPILGSLSTERKAQENRIFIPSTYKLTLIPQP